MQSFFEKPASDKGMTKSERKQRILETNELINKLIDDFVNDNYEDTCSQLREKGYDDDKIEEFLKEFKRELQIDYFKRFKEILREKALSSQQTGHIENT